MILKNSLDSILHYPLVTLGEAKITLVTLFDIIVVLILSFVAAFCMQWFLNKRLLKLTKAESGFQYMLSRLGAYVIFILCIFVGLQLLGIDLTSFTVLAGAIGVGIGFGLQNIVNNFICGIIVLSERLIQVGDRIEVGGVSGQIQQIGARSSSLLTSDHLLVIVPNSELVSKSVTRWGRGEKSPVRFSLMFKLDYGISFELVKNIVLKIVDANPHILKTPPPSMGIKEFGDHWVITQLSFSTASRIFDEMGLKTELYVAIQQQFKEVGIEWPHPTIALTTPQPVQVKL